MADPYYKSNQLKDPSLFKKIETLPGYVSDTELNQEGGQYTKKELMTYREYVNVVNDGSIRHDIDPQRMVWVLISKFNTPREILGRTINKAVIASLYDAETGQLLSTSIHSEDPNGIPPNTRRKP